MTMTAIEHRELKGITLRNSLITIGSTISIVVTLLTNYYSLKSDMKDIKWQSQTDKQVTQLQIKVLESRIATLEIDIKDLKAKK